MRAVFLLILLGVSVWYLADRHDCYWHGVDLWAPWMRCVVGLNRF
jgi:hypothetical protein